MDQKQSNKAPTTTGASVNSKRFIKDSRLRATKIFGALWVGRAVGRAIYKQMKCLR